VERLYETSNLLALAAQWRLQSEQAEQPAHKEYCLRQALRFEQILQRSLEVPAVTDPKVTRLVG
jgi:hypothetical protein